MRHSTLILFRVTYAMLQECEPDAFRSALGAIAALHSATFSAAEAAQRPSINPDTTLLEDIECQGLLPLKLAIGPRSDATLFACFVNESCILLC